MFKKLIYLVSFVLVLALVGNATAQIDPATVETGHVYLLEDVNDGAVSDDSANAGRGRSARKHHRCVCNGALQRELCAAGTAWPGRLRWRRAFRACRRYRWFRPIQVVPVETRAM